MWGLTLGTEREANRGPPTICLDGDILVPIILALGILACLTPWALVFSDLVIGSNPGLGCGSMTENLRRICA